MEKKTENYLSLNILVYSMTSYQSSWSFFFLSNKAWIESLRLSHKYQIKKLSVQVVTTSNLFKAAYKCFK